MESKELMTLAVKALEDKIGEDIRVLNIGGVSSIADYFVIATCNSSTHVHSLADAVEEKLKKEAGESVLNAEGYQNADWVLLDYGNVIVHIFSKDQRLFYDLERIWKDGVEIDLSELN